ncbi:MAG: hypothetical protein FGM52_07115 [Mycobacterium sp.]|nr:hypothetical protein [Mycobacterium sp.]
MNTTTATKKFALATLAAPVLAALAIGMAGAAHADNETANHPINNRVNSYTGQQSGTATAAHSEVPSAIRGGGAGCATAGANTQGRATVIRSNAAPRLESPHPGYVHMIGDEPEIDKWTNNVTKYLNYGNFIGG